MDNDTSLIIPVAEAAFLQPFRTQHLHRPGATMPPHVTLRSPFKSLRELTAQDYQTLAALFASIPPFTFTLNRLARFAEINVLYMEPDPIEPFMALYQQLFAHYPDPPSDHPTVVFHLTLTRTERPDIDALEAEFFRTYGTSLPIEAVAREVCLYEERGERWFLKRTFPVGKSQNNA